jgi:hypothetical protein
MLMLYDIEALKNNEDLFIVWIDQAEAIISEKVSMPQYHKALTCLCE